ncbi:MAG: 6-hydroxymethylpterin diphosphokinase MptE-like protein [Flavobacteriaceae bacterium]|nr:6-hydroxymethylpterin diphosphokinase MptE-like protein [Flavobacteriaceae bacterium]
MYWKSLFLILEFFFEVTNIAQRVLYGIKSVLGFNNHIKVNLKIKNAKKGDTLFIVGNGPSIKEQSIESLSKENSIFVNMGFKHPLYKHISPRYHVIVDPKLANGEWDLGILDEIVSLNPEVTLVLNGKWYHLAKFKPYINNPKFNIVWVRVNLFFTKFHTYRTLDISKITYGMGVLGAAIALASHLGAEQIILLGAESNAFCYEFEDKESHFYGLNQDNNNMSSQQICKSLFFNYLYLLGLLRLSERSKGINIKNCTKGGILKMFERGRFEDELTCRGERDYD